ncbi:hypothetical protein OGATHE_006488 [Ogataea polymorpha]|uniref:Uncharacterized protein n=1 Tax=Ogataea polymorpha TaxID=460523 RepID=A0A9P8NSS0_9ASCO|nr:hypothetical protein OGATHE_006488 [Ogataea polymorpha]
MAFAFKESSSASVPASSSMEDDPPPRVELVSLVRCPPYQPAFILSVIVHVSTTTNQETVVIGPLGFGQGRTVISSNFGAIKHLVAISFQGDEIHISEPIINSFSCLGIRIIGSVSGYSSSNVEQTSIGHRVFVVITRIPCKDLPSQASTTVTGIPSGPHGVVHCLSQPHPRNVLIFSRRVGEVSLSSLESRKSPKCLIVVTFSCSLI